jgi:hypothetical protein
VSICSFGHQVLKDWKIFNMTPVGDVKYTQNGDLMSHHSLLIETPYEPRPNVTYMIKVFVIDNRGCKGPGINYTFTSELNFLLEELMDHVAIFLICICSVIEFSLMKSDSWLKHQLYWRILSLPLVSLFKCQNSTS